MRHLSSHFLTTAAIVASTTFLFACGGGGSSSTPPPALGTTPPPPVSSAPTFTKDSFQPASRFVDQCETPRSGNDPDGNRYTDMAGSTLIEKFWLRSWSNETYLWNTEIEDVDPNSIASRTAYFDVLKSNELSETGSGREKDDFHFSESTEDFFARRNSTAVSGYGVRFVNLTRTDANGNSILPREFRVLYTEPDSPASAVVNGNVNLPRGAQIIEVDGADLLNGSDVTTLNNGLFPSTAGETHVFKIREPITNIEREITIVSEDIAPEPVNRTRIIETDNGKVGYMLFNTFSPFESEKSLADAFTLLSNENVDDLVLDLRYNGGGLVAVAAQLGYMIAGPSRTAGKTAALLQYNEAAGNRNPIDGTVVEPFPFFDEGLGFSVPNGQALNTVDLPRVFILSTGGTCSASELVLNSLRGIDHEIILIGDTTCGKPYGFLPTDNCGQTYYTIQFQSVNDKGIGDYSDGFSPSDSSDRFSEKLTGCSVPDDLTRELGDEREALLATALSYRETGTCPIASTKSAPASFSKMREAAVITGQEINIPNDPYIVTADSFLDATMPKSGQ